MASYAILEGKEAKSQGIANLKAYTNILKYSIQDIHVLHESSIGRSAHLVSKRILLIRCINSTCAGMAEGEGCRNISDCNPGMFCNSSSQCQIYKKEGDTCLYNSECGRKGICYYSKIKQKNGVCRQMFSVADGDKIGTDFEYEYKKGNGTKYLLKDMNMLCSSQYADEYGNCKSNEELPISLRKGKRCISDFQCPTTMPNRFGKCKCGFNRDKVSFCDLVEGDDEWLTVRKSV